jgi:hypothetical protein
VDVSLASVVLFLHVVAAVAFIAGLIARGIVLDRARKATDIGQVDWCSSPSG